ncbi:hypothetical protein EV401DRAFT_1886663 [Pisolithus croceorrhizus]|nr:hypothetical protein EV401DRAFT_1886663 [Pisolithus croceorrhizus]
MPSRPVSIGDNNIPTPQSMPIAALSSTNQDFTFGRPVSPNEGHVARCVKGEISAGDGKPTDGKDDMTSSGDVDLNHPETLESNPMGPVSQDINEDKSNLKLETSVEEGIGTSLELTIKPMTLEECPESIRSWCSVDTNVSSQVGGAKKGI